MKKWMIFTLLAGLLVGCTSVPPSDENEGLASLEAIADPETRESEVETHDSLKVLAPATKEEAKAVETKEAPTPVEPTVDEVAVAVAAIPVVKQNKERNTIMVLIKTSKGDIKVELNEEKAPKTVANFMKYVNAGHYTGTIFHRVIDNFMIQGGGFTANMSQKNAPHTVENEADNGLSNDLGTIAMARTPDPHSGGAQFFINVKDNAFLNHTSKTSSGWGYCVFGKVVEGMDVVNAIKVVPTAAQDVPTETITIEEIVVVDA